jgi:hypothetical protein
MCPKKVNICIAFPFPYSQEQNINIPEIDNLSASLNQVFLVFLGPCALNNVCSSSLGEQMIHSHTPTTEVKKGTFFLPGVFYRMLPVSYCKFGKRY